MASSELETIKTDTSSTEIKTKKGARGKYKGSLISHDPTGPFMGSGEILLLSWFCFCGSVVAVDLGWSVMMGGPDAKTRTKTSTK